MKTVLFALLLGPISTLASAANCAALEAQHRQVQQQLEQVCDRDDAASQRQCRMLEQRLVQIGDAMQAAGCDGGGEEQ